MTISGSGQVLRTSRSFCSVSWPMSSTTTKWEGGTVCQWSNTPPGSTDVVET